MTGWDLPWMDLVMGFRSSEALVVFYEDEAWKSFINKKIKVDEQNCCCIQAKAPTNAISRLPPTTAAHASMRLRPFKS